MLPSPATDTPKILGKVAESRDIVPHVEHVLQESDQAAWILDDGADRHGMPPFRDVWSFAPREG